MSDHAPEPNLVSILDENYLHNWENAVGPDVMPMFIAELLTTFDATHSEHAQAIAEACQNKDTDTLQREIHFIKGSLGNIGLNRASAYARQAEIELRTDNFTRFDSLPGRLEEYIGEGLVALRARYA